MEALAPRICIPARSHCLQQIRDFCKDILEGRPIDRQLHRKIVLAVDEAVANVIEHAYSENLGDVPAIELSIELQSDRIVVRIVDRGMPFDPSRGKARVDEAETAEGEPSPMSGPSPSSRSFHRKGFGLQLIRLIMDEIDYRRTPKGENVLTLTKRLDQGGS